jgi:hypothetical protein
LNVTAHDSAPQHGLRPEKEGRMMANELKDAQDISPKIVGAVLSNIVFDYEDVSGNPFAILYDTGLARIKYPRGNHVEFLRENPEQAAQEVRDVFTALAKGSSVEIHWTPKGLSLAELIEWLASNTTNKQCQSRADSLSLAHDMSG